MASPNLVLPERPLLEAYFCKNLTLRGWPADVLLDLFMHPAKITMPTLNCGLPAPKDVFSKLTQIEATVQSDGTIYLSEDILALAFILWTGLDKFNLPKDSLGRVRAYSVEQYVGIDVRIPYLDLAIQKFEKCLCDLGFSQKYVPKASVCMTADIDYLYQTWKQTIKYLWKQQRLGELLVGLFSFVAMCYQPYVFLQQLATKFNFRWTFFLLPEIKVHPIFDSADYQLNQVSTQFFLNKIHQNVRPVWGVHAGFAVHDTASFSQQVDKLNKTLKNLSRINRFHFLRFQNMSFAHILNSENIEADSSMAFSDKPGFYNATCHPFYLFDMAAQEITQVLEIPLAILDSQLFYENHLALQYADQALAFVQPIIHHVEMLKGILTVDIHPNNYAKGYKPEYRLFLECFLQTMADKNISFLTPLEVQH